MMSNQQHEEMMNSETAALHAQQKSDASAPHFHPKDHSGNRPTREGEAHRLLLDPFRCDENDRLASRVQPPSFEAVVSTDLKTPPPFSSVLRRDLSRGPLKKRPNSPVPHRARWAVRSPAPPPSSRSLVAQASINAIPCAPLLRESSSTFSVYSYHQHLPPQLYLTSSCGRQLMSEPLLATPTHVCMTPRSACDILAQVRPPVGESCLTNKDHHEGNATPGLDLLAEQVIIGGRNAVEPVPKTWVGSKQMERIPVPVTLSRSKETKRLSASKSFEFSSNGLPTPPEQPWSSTGCFDQPTAYTYMGYRAIDYASRRHQAQHPCPYEYGQIRPSIGSLAHRVHTIPPSIRKNQTAVLPPLVELQTAAGFPCIRKNYQALASPRPYLPPEDPVESIPALFAQAPGTRKACKCGNSQCLKLYCECFHSGALCDSNLCRCKDCKNNEENNESKGVREYAILRIMAKRPDAFHTKVKRRGGKACKCKKSNCLKKYCECIVQGRKCTSECKCYECKNSDSVS